MGITQQIGASSLIKPGVVDNTANRPASPYEGQVIFQKDTDQLLVWNGTAWVIPNSPAQNPQGLELISTTTVGTTVSTVTVSNVFSATYDNYLIKATGGVFSGTATVDLQLGSTVTNYKYQLIYGTYANGTPAAEGTTTAIKFRYMGMGTTTGYDAHIDVMSPYLAKHTKIIASEHGPSDTGSLFGIMENTTSYTSFNIFPSSGTMTGGTIRVYGYRNS